MSFFSRILPQAGSTSPQDERKTRQDAIEKLCSGLLHAALLEDRRASAQALKAASKHYQLEIGTIGMPCLASSLKRDHEDIELARSILETFINICSRASSTEDKVSGSLDQQFCEMFLKDKEVIDLVLACSKERNMYVRYDVLQLLSVLEDHLPTQLPNAILSSPSGLSRLLDLLEDDREIIRNEAVLLLQRLTRTNPEIQKIAVFENTFEKTMDLALSDGGGVYLGDVIVQDALSIVHNLLRHNPSNQNYFRESICFSKLKGLILPVRMAGSPQSDREALSSPKETYRKVQWSEQISLNLIAALEILCIVANIDNPKLSLTQESLLKIGIFVPLVELALAEFVPIAVRAKSLDVLDRLMFQNEKVQALFTRQTTLCGILDLRPIPVVLSVISTAVESAHFKLRIAAANAIGSYLSHNPDGQVTIAATFKSPTIDRELSKDEQSAGSIIISGTLDLSGARRDRYHVWFSQVILSHVLRDNDQSKTLALKHQELSTDGEEENDSATFLGRIVSNLIESSKDARLVQTSVAYLMLLATWMHGFPLAVSAFLSEGSNVQFLIELLSQNSTVDGMIQGCTAFVFGMCIIYHDMSQKSFSRSALKDIVKTRIGVDVFSARVLRVRDAIHAFLASSNSLDSNDDERDGDGQVFDSGFANLFLDNYDHVLRVLSVRAAAPSLHHGSPFLNVLERGVETDFDLQTTGGGLGSGPEAALARTSHFEIGVLTARISELQLDVEAKEKLINELRSSSEGPNNKNLESKCAYLSTENDRLQKLAEAYATQLMQIEKDHEELLVILASYDSELKQLRQHLSLAEQGDEPNECSNASDVDLNLQSDVAKESILESIPEMPHHDQKAPQAYTTSDGSVIPTGSLYQETERDLPPGRGSFSVLNRTHEV